MYQSCVPKSMGSHHPLRNIDYRFDRHSGECRYINLEGRFPLPLPLCPLTFPPADLLNFLVKTPVRALRRTSTFSRARLRSQPRAMMSALAFI